MKKYIGVFLTCTLFFVVAIILNYVCNPYNDKADRVVRGLYSEEAIFDDLDIAFIGGSHGCNGFNPHVVYKNTGLTAFNFSLSGEPVTVNYYYLKEMFKTKKPSVVVLDVYYLGMKNDTFSMSSYYLDIARNFKYNKNRFDMLFHTGNAEEILQGILPLLVYHSRFDSLTKQDFVREPDLTNDYLLGSTYYFERNASEEISFEQWEDTENSGGMTAKNQEYLQKIIDLVRENDVEILLVDLPHNHVDSGAPDAWTENEYEVMNQAKEIAKKNQVKFLQYDGELLNEIGFIAEEDMYNKGHMNYWGSVKTSTYLGTYLSENYDFDMNIEQKEDWDAYLAEYEKLVKESIQ